MVQISNVDLNWKIIMNEELQTSFNTELNNRFKGDKYYGTN